MLNPSHTVLSYLNDGLVIVEFVTIRFYEAKPLPRT
jgi:hypothetical protein